MFTAYCAWLLAAGPETHEFHFSLQPLLDEAGLPLALVGMFMVFIALTVVVLFITYLPQLVSYIDRWIPAVGQGKASPPTASDADKKKVKGAEGVDADPQLMVVLAAAVAVAISEPHRIVFARSSADNLTWAREGRRQIQTSHRVN